MSTLSTTYHTGRRGLLDLPVELKERIVELCAEQDDIFREYQARSPPKPGRRGERVASPRGSERRAGSLRALFQTHRELSTMAAQFLFKTLKASKADVHFQCNISNRRASLFRELHFDTVDTDKLMNIVGAMPRLSNLSKLVLQHRPLERLYNYAAITLDEAVLYQDNAKYAAAAFKRIGSGILELHTSGFSTHTIANFAGTFTSLRCLRVEMKSAVARSNGLIATLAFTKVLEELHILCKDDDVSSTPFDLSPACHLTGPAPPLRRLFITSQFTHTSHLAFASLFSSTLERLSFTSTFTREASVLRQPIFNKERFERLTFLSFRGSDHLLYETVTSILPRHLPALRTLELCLSDVPDWDDEDSPLTALHEFSTLEHLRIPNFASLPCDAREQIQAFCLDCGLHLTTSPTDPVERLVASGSDDEADTVRPTLQYIAEEVDVAEMTGDDETIKRFKTALQGLETERTVEQAWRKA
ncbi:hypothetical protein JCM10213_008863 [Rhodosporidiobolus nylandii]